MTSSADRLGLALSDLHAVSDVASALAEGDQSIVRVSDGRSYLDPYVPRLLETGLVITYMRLFTKARGYGDDGRIPEEWVPEEHRELHRFLVTRRHKHEAHTDGTAPLEHRRRVSEDQPGWIMIGFPDSLTIEQRRELADLALKLVDVVTKQLGDAQTVHTPVDHRDEKSPD